MMSPTRVTPSLCAECHFEASLFFLGTWRYCMTYAFFHRCCCVDYVSRQVKRVGQAFLCKTHMWRDTTALQGHVPGLVDCRRNKCSFSDSFLFLAGVKCVEVAILPMLADTFQCYQWQLCDHVLSNLCTCLDQVTTVLHTGQPVLSCALPSPVKRVIAMLVCRGITWHD